VAKARKILDRLHAVRNVRTVTGAMEMVASTQFKKTHKHAVAIRPYTIRLTDLVEDVVRRCGAGTLDHPLLREPIGPHREVLVALTSSRGLCGAYNSRVLALAAERFGQLVVAEYDVRLHVVGKKGIQYLRFRDFRIDREYKHFGSPPDYDRVAALAEELMTAFLDGKISGLEVAYMQFLSAGRQSPAIAQILPLSEIEPSDQAGTRADEPVAYELIPSPRDILENLLPAMVRLRLYQCFLDAAVGEQIARISAMRAANENADEMIHDLTIRSNRLRQSQITTELAEILGGHAGLQ